MAFSFMCIFIFILCHFLSVSKKILNGKCLLAKIKENIMNLFLPHRVDMGLIILKSSLKVMVVWAPQMNLQQPLSTLFCFQLP